MARKYTERRADLGQDVPALLIEEAVTLVELSVQTYGETPPLRRELDGLRSRLATLRGEPAPSSR